MKTYSFSVDFWQEQICIGSGRCYGEIDADSEEEAEQIVQRILAMDTYDAMKEYGVDWQEDNCEVSEAEEYNYDLSSLVLDLEYDDAEELEDLKEQRDVLDQKIAELENRDEY